MTQRIAVSTECVLGYYWQLRLGGKIAKWQSPYLAFTAFWVQFPVLSPPTKKTMSSYVIEKEKILRSLLFHLKVPPI
jgi:hypothetical protein